MRKASIPWNCKQVHKMMMNNSLVFDNAIQRGFVWDKNRQSLLIDSILRGYPIPPFYTIKDGRTVQTPKGQVAVFDGIDGKQRCTTIKRFKENEFALCNLEDPIVCEDGTELDLNGLTYADLPDDLRDTFDSYALTVNYFDEATEEEVTEIMSRLNNGRPLSAAENTRITAADLPGIQEVARHPVFTENFSETAINGYQNEDIVVKTYAVLTQDNKSLDNKDIKPIYKTLIMDDVIKARLYNVFDSINSIHETLLFNKNKKAAKKLVTRTHMISIAPIIEKAIAEDRDANDMARFFAQFFDGKPSTNDVYNAACSNGSNHAPNVNNRLLAVQQEYDWYFGNNEFAEGEDGEDEE